MPVFANTGIERRYSCVPLEWYYAAHGWSDRNAIYRTSAVDLLEQAARQALSNAHLEAEDVATIVVVSTTGIATPSLDALLMQRMKFQPSTQRLPIFGLGCVGGALGLARAATMAQARPGSNVLFLVIELCALWFRREEVTKSNIVATALFGDGAAAVVLSTDASGPAITDSGEYTFPNTLDIMGWDVADDGLAAIFSRDIPKLVQTQFRPVLDAYLDRQGRNRASVDRYLSHPGGTKVLAALEEVFGLHDGDLVDSRSILRDYGNMSAATVIFVLERAMREGAIHGTDWNHALLTAMGPGFTAAFVSLTRT